MLITAVATAAIFTTGAVSASSILLCRRLTPPKEPVPPVVFSLGHKQNSVEVTTKLGKKICEFHKSTSYRIVNNLYRLFGSVAISNSEKEVALLYRNTVGNGGYIDFWSQNFSQQLIFQNILWKLQGKENSDLEQAPLRIYILLKLAAGTYELVLDDASTRYLWTKETRELHKVTGSEKVLAAKLEKLGSETTLTIHRDVINPYLAVCTCLFFNTE